MIAPPFTSFALGRQPASTPEPSAATRARAANRGRTAAAAVVVAGLHAVLIWTLLSALDSRPVEIVVPIEMVAELIASPAPQAASAPPAPTAPPAPPPTTVPRPPVPTPAPTKKAAVKTPAPPVSNAAPAPQPLAVPDPTRLPEAAYAAPAASSSIAASEKSEAVAAAATAAYSALSASAAPQGSSASAAVQFPSSDAAYLQNPAPPYPALSKRMGERGKTVVRVLIGADGEPQKAELAASSGFERLDNASIAAVMRWRFVPGKRGGVPETMWFNVPIKWELQN